MAHQQTLKIHNIIYSLQLVRILGWGSLLLLFLVVFAFLFPISTTSTNAKDSPNYNKPAWIPSNYVSLSLGSMPAMDITPTGEGGSVGVSQASLKVSTTSNTGYKLYVSTLDHTTAMTSTDTNQSAAIASTNTIATASNLAPNTWGYTITDAVSDSTTYSPMPTTSTVAYDTAQASGEHYLSFAAKIDTSLPAGQYSNTVAISAIANPAVITGMMELTYMQDMTSSICHDTVGYDQNYNRDSNGSYIITPGSEVTKQLIDSRDGKEYWVAKLADGNCWMTQNLALDLNEKTLPLKPETSDVSGEWRPGSYTENSVPNVATPTFTSTRSWNLGKVVLATPTRGVNCVAVPTSDFPDNDSGDSLRPNQKLGEVCSDFVDVSGENWYPTFEADKDGFRVNNGYGDGIWLSTNYDSATGNVVYSTYDTADDTASPDGGVVTVERKAEGGKYDAHYLIGNYYQWGTAVAGTNYIDGRPVVSGSRADPDKLVNTKDSICPKGWKLPVAGGNTKTGQPFVRQDSFVSLFAAYGYPTDNYTPSSISGYTPFLNGENQNPELAPFYYPRSGVVFASYGVMIYTGMIGSASSSTIAPGAYKFAFTMQIGSLSNADVLHTSGDSSRFMAKNVRCMAR